MHRVRFAAVRVFTVLGALSLGLPLYAGSITLGEFSQFSFTGVGVPAAGCDPADPAGAFCIGSSGTPTTFLDAPPWTFVAPVQGVLLSVTDAFQSGDRFNILDNGLSIGLTSAFTPGVDCGDDPAVCITTPGMSTGTFLLGAGSHSLTIVPVEASPFGGTGYFLAEAVPEPATWLSLATALVLAAMFRRKRTLKIRMEEIKQ